MKHGAVATKYTATENIIGVFRDARRHKEDGNKKTKRNPRTQETKRQRRQEEEEEQGSSERAGERAQTFKKP